MRLHGRGESLGWFSGAVSFAGLLRGLPPPLLSMDSFVTYHCSPPPRKHDAPLGVERPWHKPCLPTSARPHLQGVARRPCALCPARVPPPASAFFSPCMRPCLLPVFRLLAFDASENPLLLRRGAAPCTHAEVKRERGEGCAAGAHETPPGIEPTAMRARSA